MTPTPEGEDVTHPHTKALAEAIDALESIALAGMSGTGQESDGAMTAWHARRAWEFIRTAARALEPARAALASPQEQAPGAEPVAEVRYTVAGFVDGYGTELHDKPIGAAPRPVYFRDALTPSSPGAAEAGEAVAGEKLWLWKNGDHYLAYRHLYPCFTPGGDPMTLGEPVGYALIRESHDRATPSKPHFMSMEAAQNRATQREHGRIDGMVGALKKIQEERKAEAEARPVGYADPLSDFQEGQWWVLELDKMVASLPVEPEHFEFKRAVACVHHMLRSARQALSAAPVDLASQTQQARAWEAVAAALDIAMPDWRTLSMRGVESACIAIGRLALSAAPREVAGWKLVPVEPTEAMWDAGREPVMYRDMNHYRLPDMPTPAWQIGPTGKVETDTSKGTTAVHVWRAMLAAAPQEGTT
jgi:hypothetical protein